MSTSFPPPPPPPPPPNLYQQLPPRPGRKTTNQLVTLAIVFVVVFIIAFGLCSVGIMGGGKGQTMISASLYTEAICAAGLVVLGIIGIVRVIIGAGRR